LKRRELKKSWVASEVKIDNKKISVSSARGEGKKAPKPKTHDLKHVQSYNETEDDDGKVFEISMGGSKSLKVRFSEDDDATEFRAKLEAALAKNKPPAKTSKTSTTPKTKKTKEDDDEGGEGEEDPKPKKKQGCENTRKKEHQN